MFPKTLEQVHKQLINPQMSDDLAQEEERSVMLSCSRKGKQQVPGVVWGVSPVLLELLREGLSRAPHARPEHSHGPQRHVGGHDPQQQISEARVYGFTLPAGPI